MRKQEKISNKQRYIQLDKYRKTPFFIRNLILSAQNHNRQPCEITKAAETAAFIILKIDQ